MILIKRTAAMVGFFFLLTSCGSDAETFSKDEQNAWDYQLAKINDNQLAMPHRSTMKKIHDDIDLLAQKFGENRDTIADNTLTAVKMVREDNHITLLPLDFLDGMNESITQNLPAKPGAYLNFLAIFSAYRIEGKSQQETITLMKTAVSKALN